MNKTHKGTKKGFTLLEILLVIAAIGILAAIVLVAINPNRQIAQARNAQRRSDVNTIYKALEQYLIDNQSYEVGGTGINNDVKNVCKTGTEQVGGATSCTGKADLRVLVPTYLAAIPIDPAGGEYTVRINSENNRISVSSPDAELSQKIVINPLPPTPEELIQEQITAGTLIPTGTQQLVLNRLVYKNNAGTQTYIDKATTTKVCPANYIPVPGNSMYGTSDFCVMKYEAKTTSPAATTQAVEGPALSVTQTNAIAACNNNNTGGVTGYGLINNAEWMTIARNIEAVSSNWRNGIIGSTNSSGGGLWKGHSDGNPFTTYMPASNDDNDGYFNTNNISPSEQKRTHTLSNGQVIWDLSGNVWEWLSDTIMGVDKPTGGNEFTDMTGYGQLSYDLVRPSNTDWISSQNAGYYSQGSTTGGPYALLRGEQGFFGSSSGVFALTFGNINQVDPILIGFRCVKR